MIYHWMVTVLLFCKPSQAFFFFFASTEKCNPETWKNYVWLRVKLDLRPKFFLWIGYVKKFCQTKGDLCASCKEVQVYSKTHWFHWLWDTENHNVVITAHQQTDHMPAPGGMCSVMLALLQPGVPAALLPLKKGLLLGWWFFFSSPKSQSWSSAALGLLLRCCLLLLECHGVCCELSILMP